MQPLSSQGCDLNLSGYISKCVVLKFDAYSADNRLDFNYSRDGMLLEFATSHRDLCALVDTKLPFHDHVGNLYREKGVTLYYLLQFNFYGLLVYATH